MLTMVLRCHHCGQEFPGGVSLGAQSVHDPGFGGLVYECTHCGGRGRYFTAEHRLRDVRGFSVVIMPGPRPNGPSRPEGPSFP
jgi:DNA-directed RNA polymerase subunit RPC12/RpoP